MVRSFTTKFAQSGLKHRSRNVAEWKPLSEAPKTGDCIVCDARTGEWGVSSYEDQDYRRGWRHRNGFNTATHFLAGVPDMPRAETCTACSGETGALDEGGAWAPCAKCGGLGFVVVTALQSERAVGGTIGDYIGADGKKHPIINL